MSKKTIVIIIAASLVTAAGVIDAANVPLEGRVLVFVALSAISLLCAIMAVVALSWLLDIHGEELAERVGQELGRELAKRLGSDAVPPSGPHGNDIR